MPDTRLRLRQALQGAVHQHQNEAVRVGRCDAAMGGDTVVFGER